MRRGLLLTREKLLKIILATTLSINFEPLFTFSKTTKEMPEQYVKSTQS